MKKLTNEETNLIFQIAHRAGRMMFSGMTLDFALDISCAHLDTPLNLQKFLDSPDFDFAHDVIGIHQHIDHNTRKIDGRFLPRCAQPSQSKINYVPRKQRVDDMMKNFA
jgi:hypothetical protein